MSYTLHIITQTTHVYTVHTPVIAHTAAAVAFALGFVHVMRMARPGIANSGGLNTSAKETDFSVPFAIGVAREGSISPILAPTSPTAQL